jgi:hypothetical protein
MAEDIEKRRARAAAWYTANSEKVRAKAAAWSAANAEKKRATQAAYRAANAEKIRAYRTANVETLRAKSLARYHANPEAARAKAVARRRADPERARETMRKYQKANAEKLRLAQAARRAADPEKARAIRWRSDGLPTPTRPMTQLCECCGKPSGKQSLALDHCHVSGEFRGWLCNGCNWGIGALGDSIYGLMNAVRYLERTTQQETTNDRVITQEHQAGESEATASTEDCQAA